MLSILVSAETSQSMVEFVHSPVLFDLFMTPQAKHLDTRIPDKAACLTCFGIAAMGGMR